VKVIPSNQTLILAGEHGAQGGRSGTVGRAFVAASGAAVLPSGGAVLKRVTMVTEFPDSTRVYVRADYASHRDTAPDNVVAIQPQSISPQTQDANVSDGALGTPGSGNALVTTSGPLGSGLSRISGASKDVYGNPQTLSGQAGLSAHLRPEEQYAQTQRILADTRPTAHLDVHA
jgi:hypothetical protein